MTHRTNLRTILLFLQGCVFLAATTMLMGCKNKPQASDRLLIVSIEPLRYVVESVAGDKFQVKSIMPKGASPETYEPTPRQMMELNHSRMVFRAGTLGFEQTSLPRMLENVPHLSLTDLAKGVKPVYGDCHQHGASDSMDPHTWMSTDNLRIMARNACHALSATDPENKLYYESHLQEFCKQLDQLDAEISTTLKPIEHRAFLIYHPALGYFARQYGLTQLSIEHDGKEATASRMSNLIQQCKAYQVKVVFVSEEHRSTAPRQMAQNIGARLVRINPLDYDVPEQMRLIAKALKEASDHL